MYFIQNYVLSEILKLSENTSRYQDTTILCKNGKFKSNSFLLSAIFPIFKRVLSLIIHNDEPLVISMPDIDKSDLEIFFQCPPTSLAPPIPPNYSPIQTWQDVSCVKM